jgi:predicted MFS family arabinose efflux permease
VRLPADLAVLRLRNFRLVFGAALVSLLGDGVVPVALAFAVLDLTGSATDLGIVLAARTIALVASLLVGGVVADRVGRRAVMVSADVVRLVTQAAIAALLVSGHATVLEIALSQVLLGAASGFFNPASSGLIPVVAGEWLQQANALRGMALAAGNIAGPAIAGVLVVAAGPGWALLVDAASYGASAALLARVPPDRDRPARATHFLTDLRDGFDEVRSRTWLWATIAVFSLVNAFAAAFPVLGALTAKRYLGGASAWAAILVARAVGSLIGGTSLLRLRPRRPLLVTTLAGMITALPTVLLAAPAPLAVIVIGALISGIGPMVFNTLWETTLQQHIPAAARSRVSSYDWFGSVALQPVGYALMGPLAAGIGLSGALYLCGGLEFAALASLLTIRDIRTLPPRPVAERASDGRGDLVRGHAGRDQLGERLAHESEDLL